MPVEIRFFQVEGERYMQIAVPESSGAEYNLVQRPIDKILTQEGQLDPRLNDRIQYYNQRTRYRGQDVRGRFVGETLGTIDRYLLDNPSSPENEIQALRAIRRAVIAPEIQEAQRKN